MWAERAPHRCVAISPFSVVLCLSPYSAAASQPASRARQAAWFYMCYVTPASSSSPPPLVIRHGFISVAGMRGKSKVCSPKHSTPRSACGGEARQHAGCACWAGRPTSPSAGAMPPSPCRTGWARARVCVRGCGCVASLRDSSAACVCPAGLGQDSGGRTLVGLLPLLLRRTKGSLPG